MPTKRIRKFGTGLPGIVDTSCWYSDANIRDPRDRAHHYSRRPDCGLHLQVPSDIGKFSHCLRYRDIPADMASYFENIIWYKRKHILEYQNRRKFEKLWLDWKYIIVNVCLLRIYKNKMLVISISVCNGPACREVNDDVIYNRSSLDLPTSTWASYQIGKIAGCAYAGNAGNVSPATDFKGNR